MTKTRAPTYIQVSKESIKPAFQAISINVVYIEVLVLCILIKLEFARLTPSLENGVINKGVTYQ